MQFLQSLHYAYADYHNVKTEKLTFKVADQLFRGETERYTHKHLRNLQEVYSLHLV